MKKIFTLSMALTLAGLYATAQINSAQEGFNPQKLTLEHPSTEKPMPPTTHKPIAGQDWWEPDTVVGLVDNGMGGKRFISDYNSQGLLEKRVRQNLGNSWLNDHQWIYTYDSNDNMSTELFQESYPFGSPWKNRQQYIYTYDVNHNMLTKLWQHWRFDVSAWEDEQLWTYTYDSNNNMQTELFQWYGNNFNQWIYTYDSNSNLLTKLYQRWWESQSIWYDSDMWTYTYDSNNNRLTELKQKYNYNDSLVNEWQIIYTYDQNNNMLTSLGQEWENNKWENKEKYTYTYDSNNNQLTSLYQIWENTWQNKNLSSYTYDSNNNRLTSVGQIWENNTWQDAGQAQWTYDENNNGISVDGSCFLYYNNMQSYFEPVVMPLINKVTASYINITNPNFIENLDRKWSDVISIYPNPTNGQLKIETVETLSATSLQNIQIFDLLGRCLHEVNQIGNTETTIDLSGFDSGMYFVRIQTEAGAVMKKIVKR